MQLDAAQTLALGALSFILNEDSLRDRFLALSGMTAEDMRVHINESDFLASVLDFLVNHEPDLIAYAEQSGEKPEQIVTAWRRLGGGVGQEW